eukprot:gene2575-2808_t
MKGFALRSLLTIGCIAALSDAFATDEVVAGISEMMAIDRSSGHEWSVFWKMVDTELTFDMTFNTAPGGLMATGKILFRKSLQMRNLLTPDGKLRTVRAAWSRISASTRQLILSRQIYMAVELVDPGRNISYVRGQLVPGNFAGGSNNDGHFVDTISNGNTVERSVSATGWVQSFASALGNKDTFSLKYSVTVEQAQKKNGALKDGVASLGVAMAPLEIGQAAGHDAASTAGGHGSAPQKLELRSMDKIQTEHDADGHLMSGASGKKETTKTTIMLLHRPRIIPSPRLQVVVQREDHASDNTTVGVPIRDLTMPTPVRRGVALLDLVDPNLIASSKIVHSGLLYAELDSDGRKLDWLLMSMHPHHVKPHVDYGLGEDQDAPWFPTTRASAPLSDTNYLQSGFWTAVPPRAPGTTMRVAVKGIHDPAMNKFSDDGTGSITFGNTGHALCLGRGKGQSKVLATFELVGNLTAKIRLTYNVAIAGSSSITSLELWCMLKGTLDVDRDTLASFVTETEPGFSNVLLYVTNEGARQLCTASLLSVAAAEDAGPTDSVKTAQHEKARGWQVGVAVLMTILLSGVAFVCGGRREARKRRHANREHLTSSFRNPLAGGMESNVPQQSYADKAKGRDSKNTGHQDVAEVWIQLTEESTGDLYYYNKTKEETKWEHPGADAIIIKDLDM